MPPSCGLQAHLSAASLASPSPIVHCHEHFGLTSQVQSSQSIPNTAHLWNGLWRGGAVAGPGAVPVAPGGCAQCRFQCSARVSDAQRRHQRLLFCGLQTRKQRWHFIASLVTVTDTTTTSRASCRRRSLSYALEVGGQRVKVCRKMFLATLGVCEMTVRTAVKKEGLKDGSGYLTPAAASLPGFTTITTTAS